MKKIELYGITTYWTPNGWAGNSDKEYERQLVATFDTRKQAEAFVKSCKLKTPKRNTWMHDEVFYKRSPLGFYGDVEICEEEENEEVPHNITFNKKA